MLAVTGNFLSLGYLDLSLNVESRPVWVHIGSRPLRSVPKFYSTKKKSGVRDTVPALCLADSAEAAQRSFSARPPTAAPLI